MALVTLKKRSEFLRLRGGSRCAKDTFVLESKPRTAEPGPPGPRVGFTVTKALGGAVDRNRIRRRLKAAVVAVLDHARSDRDYVIIARSAARECAFDILKKDLEQAFHRVHHAPGRQQDRKAGR
ncbi:MAG: ribonuclease P protein component [Hyphomicrobium sp.]